MKELIERGASGGAGWSAWQLADHWQDESSTGASRRV